MYQITQTGFKVGFMAGGTDQYQITDYQIHVLAITRPLRGHYDMDF